MKNKTPVYTIEVGPEDRRHLLTEKGKLVEMTGVTAVRNFLRNRQGRYTNPVVIIDGVKVEITY
jgi:hypothetical protein